MKKYSINEKRLLIDIDIPISIFEKHLKLVFLDKLLFCLKKFDNAFVDIIIRKSKSGNTHVYINLEKPIDDFANYLKLKFCIGDDHKRITHDILRYKKSGKVNQFFWTNDLVVKKGR
jgi:hypothetical protein